MDARTGRRPDDSPPYRVSLVEPGQIAAALPHLLGFRPRESVVLVSLTGPRAARVGLTVRVDIPPPEHAAALADLLTRSVRTDRPAAVVVLVVSEAPDAADAGGGAPDLPHRALLHEVTVALYRERIPVREALLVRSDRWWSYDCPSACCRPERGTPLPVGTSELAVASVAAGVVVADSREVLAARIAAIDGPGRSAMAAVTRRVAAAASARLDAAGADVVAEESWAAVHAGLAHCRAGTALSDAAVARILWGLRDTGVRDRALQLALDDDSAVDSLWTECVRRAPRRFVPAPATLLAVGAWLRGDGAMAAVALERALAADGRYRFALLLSQALAACLPPAELRALVHKAITDEERQAG
jgi:hypothetical protein